jgi:hypothetical protein
MEEKDPTVIPASVTAQVSLRIVPDQSLDAVCSSLVQHLRASFDALDSANSIKVTGLHRDNLLLLLLLLIDAFALVGYRRAYGRLVVGRSDASVVP